MKASTYLRNGSWIAMLTVLLAVALPATVLGQGRGRGRGRGPDIDKKCGKFVNCHDARDGRLDGRGPRQNVGVIRNRIYMPPTRIRQRAGRVDYNDRFVSRRLRNRNLNSYDVRQRRSLRNRDFERTAAFDA